MLFSGPSGSGKTTLARLARYVPDFSVLSEERAVIYPEQGQIRAASAPSHSGSLLPENAGGVLEAVYFIRHEQHNKAVRLGTHEAIQSLLKNSLAPVHLPFGLRGTLRAASRIAAGVPCFDLGFLPEASVYDLILSA